MDFKRLWAIFKARNYEFFRDRSALGWNFIFPFLLVAGFSIIFGGEGKSEYKVGLFPVTGTVFSRDKTPLPEDFQQVKHIEFIPFSSFEKGIEKLKHHKIDFLLELLDPPIDTGSAVHRPGATSSRKFSRPASCRPRS